jgi:hypothetical protein
MPTVTSRLWKSLSSKINLGAIAPKSYPQLCQSITFHQFFLSVAQYWWAIADKSAQTLLIVQQDSESLPEKMGQF